MNSRFSGSPLESPTLLLHKSFKVNAGNIEMRAYVRNLCCVRFQLLFRNDRTIFDFCAGNNERIGNGCSFQPLLFPDQALKVLNLEYLRNKLKFGGIRGG